MLKKMLEGVSVLLDKAMEAKQMKASKTFIECGQAVLEQCIESIPNEIKFIPHYVAQVDRDIQAMADALPKKVTKKVEHPEYEVRVDAKKLVLIVDKNGEEAPLDLPMEVDGAATTYSAAKGKPFSSGRFL